MQTVRNKPRKSARQARAQATEAAILEAAARILERQGAAGLTTNDIAQLAGVSIGSLYQYFPNKEAILATMVRQKRTILPERMREAARTSQDLPPEAAIEAMVEAGLMHQYTRPKLSLELETLHAQLALEPETLAMSEEMAGIILDTIRRIRPDATPGTARDVIAICKGLIAASALTGDPGGPGRVRRCRNATLGYLDRTDMA